MRRSGYAPTWSARRSAVTLWTAFLGTGHGFRLPGPGLLLQFPALFSSYSGPANPIPNVMSFGFQEWTLAVAWFPE